MTISREDKERALRFLKTQTLIDDGTPFEQSYSGAGLTLSADEVVSLKFGPFEASDDPRSDAADEVRIGYWWGNSNLYWPLTRAQWDAA